MRIFGVLAGLCLAAAGMASCGDGQSSTDSPADDGVEIAEHSALMRALVPLGDEGVAVVDSVVDGDESRLVSNVVSTDGITETGEVATDVGDGVGGSGLGSGR